MPALKMPVPGGLLSPFAWFTGICGLFLSVLIVASVMPYGEASSRGDGVASDRPQNIDPRRFALVQVGMQESQVLEILGLPFEVRGANGESVHLPESLNPQECGNQIPCHCAGAVRELFYYRGNFSESFYVYIGGENQVCCYRRSHTMIMSITAI